MIRLPFKLRYSDIVKIRASVSGSFINLAPISKIQLRIPSLALFIEDSTPTAYPMKWEHDPEDVGLIEFQLGNVQAILDSFIVSTTGDTTLDSTTISNIPAAKMTKLGQRMFVEGSGLTNLSEIISIDHSENTIEISNTATATATDVDLEIYDNVDSSIHKASLYIFNVEYPDGLFWQNIEIELGF